MTFSFKVKLNKTSLLLLLPLNRYPYRSVILRQICMFSPISIVVSISLSVCLFVCLLFFSAHGLCWQKKVKNDLKRFCYSSFTGLMLNSMTLTFKVKHYECPFLRKDQWSSKNTKHDLYRFWQLPSNYIITNVVLFDLDLHFQGQHFSNLIFCKRWDWAPLSHA